MKDTYNLLADGIVELVRALAALAAAKPEECAAQHDLARYFGTSFKGEAGIDWEDPKASRRLLTQIVADTDRLLVLARRPRGSFCG